MKLKLLTAVLLLLPAIAVNAQRIWTLQECIDTALANNRNIKQREIIREQNKIRYTQAKLNLLPGISAGANQSWAFGRSETEDGTYKSENTSTAGFSLSSRLTIFDGLRMKHNIDSRMLEMKIAETELEAVRQDMIMSVSTAFLNVLLNKELAGNAREQMQLTDRNIMQKRQLVESGKLANGELLELQAQQSREEMNLIQAQNTLAYSLLELAQILELRDFENIDVAVPADLQGNELSLLNPETVYQHAIQHRPEVQGAEYRLQNSRTGVRLARSAYFPEINFDAGAGQSVYNSITTPFSSTLRFSLSMPIFDKLSAVNQVRQAKLDVESSRIALENTKLEMRKTIQQIYASAIAAKARWTAAIKAEQASAEAFRYANQKYENSRATVYELYQAKSALTSAQSELVQAKYEYIFRLKIMELYSGKAES